LLEAVEGGTERTEVAPPLGVAELFECRLQLDSRSGRIRQDVAVGDREGQQVPYWILFDRSSRVRSEATRVSEIIEF